jgi:hypothetical protein
MDRIGITGAGNNIASIRPKGKYGVAITLKSADSQFIGATLNRAFVVPKHIWSQLADAGDRSRTRTLSGPGPSTVSGASPRRTTC